MAIDEINNSTDILPNHHLVGRSQDTGCSGSGAIKAIIAHQLELNGGEPDVIIGGGCSGGCQTSALVAEAWQTPEIGWACTNIALSDKVAFPYFLRTTAPESAVAKVFSAVCDEHNWKKISFVTENQDLFRLSAEAFMDQQLSRDEADRIEVVDNEIFESNGNEDLLDAQLQRIKDSGVRIWGVWAYVAKLRVILKKAQKLGLTGEGYQVMVGGGIGNSLLVNEQSPGPDNEVRDDDIELIKASQGIMITVPTQPSGDAYDGYTEKISKRMGIAVESIHGRAVYAYDAVYAYAHALDNWVTENPGEDHRHPDNKERFKDDYMFPVTFDSVQGSFAFDEKGDRDASLTVGTFNYQLTGTDGYSDGLPWEFMATYSGGAGYEKLTPSRGIMYSGGANVPPVDWVAPVVEEVITYETEIGIVAGIFALLGLLAFLRTRKQDSKINFLVKTVKMQNQIPR